jgi:hypothetical protein
LWHDPSWSEREPIVERPIQATSGAGFDPLSQQQHQIFPAIDLNIARQWELNFGLGVGLTGSTDHLIAKMILGYRFNF